MDIELAVDAMEMASYLDHVVLFSGDGDFRRLTEALQRKGLRVTVVSTIRTQPPMIADELRRQADTFLDLNELVAVHRARTPRGGRHRRRGGGRGGRRGDFRECASEAFLPERLIKFAGSGGAVDPRSCAPHPDCQLCPRLAAFRAANRRAFPDWHNAPVASFGDPAARLLVVGLAPGLRGANRTGRPFTGDHAGEILYATLRRFGFARGHYRAAPDDGLELIDCRITNAVRCVPPENRPLGGEVNACRRFLLGELTAAPQPKVIMPLGAIAHASVLRALALPASRFAFRHGLTYAIPSGRALAPSYHCSRYNLNTGRLTPAMFEQVFARVRALVDAACSGTFQGDAAGVDARVAYAGRT